MAVERVGIGTNYDQKHFQGLSTDTKPTTGVNPGDTFLELDTNKKWTYGNSTWYNAG